MKTTIEITDKRTDQTFDQAVLGWISSVLEHSDAPFLWNGTTITTVDHVDLYNKEIVMYFGDGHSVTVQVTELSDESEPWQDEA